jgi:hypothetical protein
MGLAFGLVFGSFAALMAFLISYNEYSHHWVDWRKPVILSLQAAVVAFVVFMAIALGSAWYFGRSLTGQP